MKSFQVSRRSFLQRCATAAALSGLPRWYVEQQAAAAAESAGRRPTPNDRPGVALVGAGGQGTRDAQNAAHWGEVLAVCDVDRQRGAAAAKKLGETGGRVPEVGTDFRRLLERDDIHVIVNGTPDHWHTLINLGAARSKKDVYAEKPLTLTIDEGTRLVRAVRAGGIVLQTGTQQRSSQRFRLACELVRNERIGRLREARVWLPAGLREGPFSPSAVPEHLDWETWLGPAPKVDYVKERCHRTFRFWYDYSGGTMTDWGAHHNDIAYWAIGLLAPRTVESRVLVPPIPGGYDTFSEYEVDYTYENGVRLLIRTTKDDSIFGGKLKPDGQRNGIRFVGTNGWIWVNRDQLQASDPDLLRTPLPADAVRLPESKDHMGNFFDCVRSRRAPICDVETGHRSATMCHLGAISMRTGRRLTWDAQLERFVGESAAEGNRHVAREPRAPFDERYVG